MRLAKIFKEPLLHFFLLGTIVYFVVSTLSPPQNDKQIYVSKDKLLAYLQYKSKAFEPKIALSMFEEMAPQDRENLIEAYIKEEALYREALAMGLERGDFVIRQRLIQKIEFLSGQTNMEAMPSKEEVFAYYNSHKQDFTKPAEITFTHIFLSSKTQSISQALKNANEIKATLNQSNASHDISQKYGDRFLYQTNYVDQSFDNVSRHFGENFASSLFAITKPDTSWAGPFQSQHGVHLVYKIKHSPSFILPFENVEDRISKIIFRERQQAITSQFIDEIVAQYEPIIKQDILSRDPLAQGPLLQDQNK